MGARRRSSSFSQAIQSATVRRLPRTLLNALTLLSLLMCAATIVFWARSYRWIDELSNGWREPTRHTDAFLVLASWYGRLYGVYSRWYDNDTDPPPPRWSASSLSIRLFPETAGVRDPSPKGQLLGIS